MVELTKVVRIASGEVSEVALEESTSPGRGDLVWPVGYLNKDGGLPRNRKTYGQMVGWADRPSLADYAEYNEDREALAKPIRDEFSAMMRRETELRKRLEEIYEVPKP